MEKLPNTLSLDLINSWIPGEYAEDDEGRGLAHTFGL